MALPSLYQARHTAVQEGHYMALRDGPHARLDRQLCWAEILTCTAATKPDYYFCNTAIQGRRSSLIHIHRVHKMCDQSDKQSSLVNAWSVGGIVYTQQS